MWGNQLGNDRHAELWAMDEHKSKTSQEISDIIFGERLHLSMGSISSGTIFYVIDDLKLNVS